MTRSTLKTLPLDTLHRSTLNVRKTGGESIESLAASILANGLIHNLIVTAEAKGKRTHGVVAGGRRLAALQLLAKRKEIASNHPVPCRIVSVEDAAEVSLSENVHRENMHPADEFDAWAALVDAGKSVEDIAARHGITPAVVERRLRLARVSPKALQLFRDGRLQLDQVMALALTTDHAAQDALLDRGHLPDAYTIRRALTESSVPATDARMRFVGRDAYERAGGIVREDLFASEGRASYYAEDAQLLDKLTHAKLARHAAKLKDLAFVDIYPQVLGYSETSRYSPAPTITIEASEAHAERIRKLEGEIQRLDDKLEALHEDETADDDEWTRLAERHEALSDELQALRERLQVADPAHADKIGAVLGLTHDGKVSERLWVIRAEDRAAIDRARRSAEAEPDNTPDTQEDTSAEPQAVRTDLTTYLTAITQNAMAMQPAIALRVLACTLAHRLIGYGAMPGVGITLQDNHHLPQCNTLGGSPAETARQARAEDWATRLPDDSDDLLAWCLAADDNTINELLAYCTARSLAGTTFTASTTPIAPIVQALGIDLHQHWQPNAGYFERVKKSATLAVLAEHGHTDKALASAKRPALAAHAEALLANAQWLPPCLAVATTR